VEVNRRFRPDGKLFKKINRRAEEVLPNLSDPAVSPCVTASNHTRVQGEGGVNLSSTNPIGWRGAIDRRGQMPPFLYRGLGNLHIVKPAINFCANKQTTINIYISSRFSINYTKSGQLFRLHKSPANGLKSQLSVGFRRGLVVIRNQTTTCKIVLIATPPVAGVAAKIVQNH